MAKAKSTEREAREARERLRRYTARQAVHKKQVKRRRFDNLFAVGGVIIVAALATVTQVFYFNGGPGTPTPIPSATAETPAAGANVGDVPDVSVSEFRTWTGTLGLNDIAMGVEFDGAAAPQAVASFVTSAVSGYYVGTACHRLVLSESAGLLQCGSLDGTGASDPSYSFGPIENAPVDGVYPAGTIAMARVADDAYSIGRQFFIVFQNTTLPADSAGGYTVLGRVTSGLDQLVAQIATAGIIDGAQDGAPVVATTITGLTIQ